jgi:hypothetical protein
MSHATCTWENQGDSWLLVGGSQTTNLIPRPSFDHNLCYKCSNGSCKTISNIYVLRAFKWYMECFNTLRFDPWNCSMKIWESIWDSNSQDERSFGSVKVHSLTLFCTPESMRCDSQVSFLACNLASPSLGHEPRARVVTNLLPSMKVYYRVIGMHYLIILPQFNQLKKIKLWSNFLSLYSRFNEMTIFENTYAPDEGKKCKVYF